MIVFCTLIYDNHNTSDIGMDPYMTTTSVPLLVSTLLNKLPNVHDDQQQVEFFYQNFETSFETSFDNQIDNTVDLY